MKIEWKTCFRVGISAFLLFLAIHYWNVAAGLLAMFCKAAWPLVLGGIIAYLLDILMCFYEKYYFPGSKSVYVIKSRRIVCMLAAAATLAAIAGAVLGLVIPELAASVHLLASKLPASIERLAASPFFDRVLPPDFMQTLSEINWQTGVAKIVQFLYSWLGGAVGTVTGAISSLFSAAVTLLFSVIFAVYLLMGKDRLKKQCLRLMKNYLKPNWNKKVCYVLSVLNNCFHRYVVGQCTEAVILGCLCTLGMILFRFPYATMTGALIGVTALIPVAGAYIGAGVGAFVILTVSPLKAVLFLLFIAVLQQLEGNLIYPKVVGTSIGLPGIWVLAAVTIGGSLLGVFGMLLSVPLAAAVYRLIREDMARREAKERQKKNTNKNQ